MQNVTRNEAGDFELNITLNEQVAGVAVTSITMFIGATDGEGDLAVNWECGNLANTGGSDMGCLMMRGSNDEVGAVMEQFYSEQCFDERLRELLVAAGFSAAAAADVTGSEWGMQDEGRASYDAYVLAAEIRAAA
jgi:hypothetical protein